MITRPTGKAAGPYEAAFLPRRQLVLRAPERPITDPVAKLGGDPVWLSEPTWPVDPCTKEPLVFIGQFPVPGDELRLAYLFLYEEGMIMGGLGPEDGDGVLLIQPGGRIPSSAEIGPPGTRGRTLWRYGPDWHSEIPVEWHLDLEPVSPEVDRSIDEQAAWERSMRGEGPDVELPDGPELNDYLGGIACYPNLRAGIDAPWQFLFKIRDSCDGGDDPYFLNFGYGYGFGFVSPDHREGRFYWERS
ncbi:hypothetical protein RM844_13315 [Streptomyces sp. DSM 44915]|uniref:DUF1963 domain-containing protein n=1 Tax=Streptomyces chisholmiae TaxID=3075540 RepID=A0ABU2JQK7_9ACTN|nr:hypothetical protein [Streptomyces sp. DSM 44915]MDT0267265.1 hypothetical protein [Streptomyces sp. DSM 44915]